MRAAPGGRRVAVTMAAAVGGVALGHVITYAAVAPDGAHRADLLAATGHALWNGGAWVALASAVVAAFSHAAREFAAGRDDGLGRGREPVLWPRPLAAVQVAAFVAMEVVERIDAGVPLATLFDRHVLVVGVVVQLLVALLLGRALGWVGDAARAAGRAARGSVPRPRPLSRRPAAESRVMAAEAFVLLPSRAPPRPS